MNLIQQLEALISQYQALVDKLYRELWENAGDSEELETEIAALREQTTEVLKQTEEEKHD